jgi:hypothetical protein
VDCSLLVRLRDMHVDCCAIINYERFVIRIFGEVKSWNSEIRLGGYSIMRVEAVVEFCVPWEVVPLCF